MGPAMPTPITHLAQGQDVLEGHDLPTYLHRLLTQQRGPFLLGNTAGDVQTVSGQRREETHFYLVPRVESRPAWQALFAAHPALSEPRALPPDRAVFVAGYVAHLLLDELWLDRVFLRHFAADWAARRERVFLHNVLRTWLDRRDLGRLDDSVPAALREAEPRGWLPFVSDADLRAWRDWLVEQLASGRGMDTVEVFARRMGIPAAEVEAVLGSPEQMEKRIFRRIPRSALRSFRREAYRDTVTLITRYLESELATG